MNIVEYHPRYEKAVVRLMAELQDYERELNSNLTPGSTMAAGHLDYLLQICEAQSGKIFLSLDDDEVVGFIVVFLEALDEGDLHLITEFRQYGYISDLLVTQTHRGSDAASSLMKAAEQHCLSAGVRRVKLSALPDNQQARRFYEKSGYAVVEVTYCKNI
jgi:ribosomal protein S18 acetylase RimI-like enzyme